MPKRLSTQCSPVHYPATKSMPTAHWTITQGIFTFILFQSKSAESAVWQKTNVPFEQRPATVGWPCQYTLLSMPMRRNSDRRSTVSSVRDRGIYIWLHETGSGHSCELQPAVNHMSIARLDAFHAAASTFTLRCLPASPHPSGARTCRVTAPGDARPPARSVTLASHVGAITRP